MLKQNLNIPGPSELPLEVLQALGTQMVATRGDKSFTQALQDVVSFAKEAFQTENDIILFTSSGTGGMESAIVNTLSPGDDILICVNGEFGSRFAIIAQNFGVKVEKIEFEWGKPIDALKVQKRLELDKDKKIKAVLAIHNETSTGILSDLDELGSVVNNHGALFVVDAVSSLGSAEFYADKWHVDIAIAASQKGLMAPPGLCLVSVGAKAWEAVKTSKLPKYYWDYRLAKGLFGRILGIPNDQVPGIPITPSIALVFALQKSMQLLKKEGLENVYQRHRNISRALRCGIKALGLGLMADERYASPTVTVVLLPASLDGEVVRQLLKEKYNIIVAKKHKLLRSNGIRIGHLGYMDLKDMLIVLAGLEGVLLEKGLISASNYGKGIAAAHQAYFSRGE